MAIVNFSVPDEVKDAFNKTFNGQNKSAIIAELMKQAVAEAQRQQRRAQAIDALTERRPLRRPMSAATQRAAREDGRP